jgi:hypothetical protein
MKYLGYELRLDGGRYTVFGPDGVRIGTFDNATLARRWVRIHRTAERRGGVSPSGKEQP